MEPLTATHNVLRWNDAVEQAFIPNERDELLDSGLFNSTPAGRIGSDGRIADHALIRIRAAMAYLKAHAGELGTVHYANPAEVGERSRGVFRTTGELKAVYLDYPVFTDGGESFAATCRTVRGFLVGDTVVPLYGVVSIEVDGDHATVTL